MTEQDLDELLDSGAEVVFARSQHGEVDRKDDRPRGRAERNPPDTARYDQPTALSRLELGQHLLARRAASPRRNLGASAEQRGRRGVQRGGELP
jgi:hypothetical protein